MISVEAHLARVLAAVDPLTRRDTVGLADATGRTLAVDLVSHLEVPPFDNSAMDGYAVRRADLRGATPEAPVELEVVADLPAGAGDDPALERGQAVRIMTGAPVPSGADAVVAVEATDGGTERVRIALEPVAGRHIRRAGEDARRGAAVLTAGTVLAPRHLAAAAAAGHAVLDVVARPRVAIAATGSELVAPGEPLPHGSIPDSNSTLLAGLAADAGAEVVAAGRLPDDPDAVRAWLAALPGCDLVVCSGGVSVGAHDVVRAVLGATGQVVFEQVAMQPGRPQAFGSLADGTPVFGLPGNPVAVHVSFEMFVRPAILRLLGRRRPEPVPLVVGAGWRSPAGRVQVMPIAVTSQVASLVAVPAYPGGSASHLVTGLAAADGFAVVPADVTEVAVGQTVPVLLAGR
ncbi:molybdopterin molybdotransferase MoeA [Agromyces sp. SYSU T00194]|uniref:molybdopterin molybdotransferase MoeA n=1 Tax=Agromyces chitinivorans TaxID=3158560 RepID=UPI003397F2F9